MKRKYIPKISIFYAALLFLQSPISWITGECILFLFNNVKYTSYLTSAGRKPVREHLVYLIQQEV